MKCQFIHSFILINVVENNNKTIIHTLCKKVKNEMSIHSFLSNLLKIKTKRLYIDLFKSKIKKGNSFIHSYQCC